MDIKNFKSGKYIKQLEYSSFLPEKIFKEWIVSSPKINHLLSEANRLLGELNAFSQLIPDVDFFIKMHISITDLYKDYNIMSALVLREFLYQL